MQTKFKLLLFDLDGTLIDSAPDLITAANRLLTETGRSALPDETVIGAIGMGTPRLVRKIFPELDLQQLEALTQRFYKIYEEVMFDRTRPYPGVVNFLKQVPRETKIAVVTNKDEALAKKIIARTEGLSNLPWFCILGGNTLAKQKPDPLPLLHVVGLANVERREAVMIGDGTPDMAAAKRAGLHSVALTFGYSSLESLRAEEPSAFIDSYAQLPAALETLARLPERTPADA